MKRTMKLSLTMFTLATMSFLTTACSKQAEITWHKLCDAATNQASLDQLVPLYKEATTTSTVLEQVPVGTVVKVIGNVNHNVWSPKYFVKVQTARNEGFMNPKCFVVDQDPTKSVYRYWEGKVTDYKYFYDPSDKKHYPKGYTYSDLATLPKEKADLKTLIGN